MSDNYHLSNAVRPVPEYLPSTSSAQQQFSSTALEVPSILTLSEFIRIIRKYRILVAGITLISLTVSILFCLLANPRYTAITTLRISSYEPVLSATRVEDVLSQRSKESNYLETQIREIASLSLADKVLSDQTLRARLFPANSVGFWSSLFSGQESTSENSLKGIESRAAGSNIKGSLNNYNDSNYKNSVEKLTAYLARVEVRPLKRTSLVTISVTTRDPALSADLSNYHARSYIEWVRDSRIEQQSEGLKFLRSQEAELKEKVAALERELADYAEAHSIVAVNKDQNITVQKMAQLNQMLTEAIDKRIQAENIYRESENALGSTDTAAVLDDPSVGSMRSKLVELQAEYENLSQKFLPTYPKMQQLKAQIDNTLSSIENQRRQIVMGLRAKAQAAIETESLLKEELEKQKSQTFELSKSQVQYNILNRELDSSRELLGNVLKQIKETSLAVRSNSTNVAIVDSATLPKYPSYPNKKLALMMGLFLGLALGLGIALLLHFMDNTIKTPEELINVVRIPSLGVIPSFEFNQEKEEQRTNKKRLATLGFNSDRRSSNEFSADQQGQKHEFGQDPDGDSSGSLESQLIEQDQNSLPIQLKDSFLPIIYVESPQSLASEAYRTIRTGILLSKAGEPPRTILVSSAQSSEGKTTSAVNLAVTLASSGGQVVIVDADLRRPSVYKYFALDRSLPGLVELLTGQAQFEELAITGLVKRLTVLPSGRIPPNPAELLGSLEMARLIDELSRRYDYVIIDSPPVLPVTDSVILSRYVDGVVMVVRGASTPRKVVIDATNRLRAVGANLLGAILNDVDVTNGDYYYYNRYYSLYYQEDGQKDGTTSAAG